MLARKHEVHLLRQVTKPLNDRVLFKETPFRAFRLSKTKISKNFQCLFHICACEYLQHLELDKSFFISTGIAYIRFEVFYNVRWLLSTAFVMPKTTLLC